MCQQLGHQCGCLRIGLPLNLSSTSCLLAMVAASLEWRHPAAAVQASLHEHYTQRSHLRFRLLLLGWLRLWLRRPRRIWPRLLRCWLRGAILKRPLLLLAAHQCCRAATHQCYLYTIDGNAINCKADDQAEAHLESNVDPQSELHLPRNPRPARFAQQRLVSSAALPTFCRLQEAQVIREERLKHSSPMQERCSLHRSVSPWLDGASPIYLAVLPRPLGHQRTQKQAKCNDGVDGQTTCAWQ